MADVVGDEIDDGSEGVVVGSYVKIERAAHKMFDTVGEIEL